MIKKQFTLYLENRPGVLAQITKRLASARVNIEGISASSSADIGLVQVVVSNAARTSKELTASGIPFTTQDVALIPLRNHPGALADVVSRVSRKGINISYVYATACDCRGECRCYAIISAPDLKKLEAALK